MVHRVLCRTPNDDEIQQARKFLAESITDPSTANNPERPWTLLAHALLASNEFTFLD